MSNGLSHYHWPPLQGPYAAALREAVTYIAERFEVLGIVAAGSILRGDAGPSSDLDIYVIHADPWRQRVQRWFHGVPAEIFVNPVQAVEGYFEQEQRAARPLTAHMLATGTVVLDRDPVIEKLRQRARDLLASPPQTDPDTLRFMRYLAATHLEDALDIAESDPPSADMIMGQAVHAILRYAFRRAGRFIPRDKDLLTATHTLDPALGDLARAYFAAPLDERPALARQIGDHTLETQGFFAWESASEAVPTPET